MPFFTLTYAVGYLVNLLALYFLVDKVGLPHHLVQGVMIFILAMLLFVALRYWVFHQSTNRKAI